MDRRTDRETDGRTDLLKQYHALHADVRQKIMDMYLERVATKERLATLARHCAEVVAECAVTTHMTTLVLAVRTASGRHRGRRCCCRFVHAFRRRLRGTNLAIKTGCGQLAGNR